MTTILLARHGESTWNREGRFQGHADPPLSELGRRQAAELGERLIERRLAAIYTSDLLRARTTAEIVAERLGLPVTTDPGLREIDVGSWSGLTRDEIEHRYPEGYERWRCGEIGHDGETREQHLERMRDAVLRIAAVHVGREVLMVSHGGSVRAIQRFILGRPQPVIENCGLYELRFENGFLRAVD